MTTMSAPTRREALDAYLRTVPEVRDGRFSLLDVALREAQTSMDKAESLWLGAAGFLIAIEQLGKTVARKNSTAARSNSEEEFRAAMADFASTVLEATRGALYALRCSLLHSFNLLNRRPGTDKHRVFALTDSGALVTHPKQTWDGTATGARSTTQTTVVNVFELRALAERCVAEARLLHQAGNLEIAPGLTPTEVVGERLMRIEPRPSGAPPSPTGTSASVSAGP